MSGVQSVTIETAYFPPLTIDTSGNVKSSPSFIGQILKPKITVNVFGQNISTAPYGQPVSHWKNVKAILLVLVFMIIVFKIFK